MISTHILDLQTGAPAQGIPVRLERFEGGAWKRVAEERTNPDGRISFSNPIEAGAYQLTFFVNEHLKAKSPKDPTPFFSEIPVAFAVTDPARKLHVPLLLSPFGYSTYRGS